MPDLDPEILDLLEQSLTVQCLRAGTNVAMVRQSRSQLPFALIGQTVEGPLLIRPEGGQPVRVPTGGGYILPEGERIQLDPTEDRGRLYIWAHVRFRVLGDLDLFRMVTTPYGVDEPAGKRIGQLNQQVAAALDNRQGSPLEQMARRRLVAAQMLTLMLELCPPAGHAAETLTLLSRFRNVFRFVAGNLDRPILRDELTAVAGLSPSRFHALFQSATGQSPMAYVTSQRLRQAQELLLTTDTAIHRIAEAVGFRDPFHFSRTFTRFAGQSPLHYRRRLRQSMTGMTATP